MRQPFDRPLRMPGECALLRVGRRRGFGGVRGFGPVRLELPQSGFDGPNKLAASGLCSGGLVGRSGQLPGRELEEPDQLVLSHFLRPSVVRQAAQIALLQGPASGLPPQVVQVSQGGAGCGADLDSGLGAEAKVFKRGLPFAGKLSQSFAGFGSGVRIRRGAAAQRRRQLFQVALVGLLLDQAAQLRLFAFQRIQMLPDELDKTLFELRDAAGQLFADRLQRAEKGGDSGIRARRGGIAAARGGVGRVSAACLPLGLISAEQPADLHLGLSKERFAAFGQPARVASVDVLRDSARGGGNFRTGGPNQPFQLLRVGQRFFGYQPSFFKKPYRSLGDRRRAVRAGGCFAGRGEGPHQVASEIVDCSLAAVDCFQNLLERFDDASVGRDLRGGLCLRRNDP